MDPSLSRILPQIEEWLSLNDVVSFIVGITSDIQQRSTDYTRRPNVRLVEIAKGSKDNLINEETALIDHFLESNLKEKCENKPDAGGIGNINNVDTLYIAYEYSEPIISTEELHVPFNDIVPAQLGS